MSIDLQALGIGISVAVSLIIGNAWAMKLVIDAAVNKALLGIERDFVTKHDFEKHISGCPAQTRST